MGVSKNSGTPKSSILIGCSIINHPFWGFSPYFWKHPYNARYVFLIVSISLGEGLNEAAVVMPCLLLLGWSSHLQKNIYIVKGCKGGCLLRIRELPFYIIHLKRKPWWAILHSFSQTSDMAIAGNAPWKNMQWYIEIYTVLGLHGISILFYQKFITCTGEKKLIHHICDYWRVVFLRTSNIMPVGPFNIFFGGVMSWNSLSTFGT